MFEWKVKLASRIGESFRDGRPNYKTFGIEQEFEERDFGAGHADITTGICDYASNFGFIVALGADKPCPDY
jgi:hypothetical protein